MQCFKSLAFKRALLFENTAKVNKDRWAGDPSTAHKEHLLQRIIIELQRIIQQGRVRKQGKNVPASAQMWAPTFLATVLLMNQELPHCFHESKQNELRGMRAQAAEVAHTVRPKQQTRLPLHQTAVSLQFATAFESQTYILGQSKYCEGCQSPPVSK